MKKAKKIIFVLILIFSFFSLSSCSFNDKDSKDAKEKSQLEYVFRIVHTGYHFVTWNYEDYDLDEKEILYEDTDDSLYNLMLSFEYEEVEQPKEFSKSYGHPYYMLKIYSEYELREKIPQADNNVTVYIYNNNLICVAYLKNGSLETYSKERYYSTSIEDFKLLIDKLELMRTENKRYGTKETEKVNQI